MARIGEITVELSQFFEQVKEKGLSLENGQTPKLLDFAAKLEEKDEAGFISESLQKLKQLQNTQKAENFSTFVHNFFHSLEQLSQFDQRFQGGLPNYLKEARGLLKNKTSEKAQLELPKSFDYSHLNYEDCEDLEEIGRKKCGHLGLVFLAGGMGERLGYSDVKVNIPLELACGKTFLELYLETQLAIKRHAQELVGKKFRIPVIIMISDVTEKRTKELLEKNNFYGVDKEEIKLVKQPMYPAIKSVEAQLAFDDQFKLIEKPPGHGCIHHLLFEQKCLDWLSSFGVEVLAFLQDTNFQAVQSLFSLVGAFEKNHSDFAFVGVEREKGKKMGVVARFLRNKEQVVGNIEYNLLKDFTFLGKEEDYLANTNTLLTRFKVYKQVIEKTKGVLPHFINPKYQEDGVTFLKAARLEQLMQDISLLFPDQQKVHVYNFPKHQVFAAVKNSVQDAKDAKDAKTMMSAFVNEKVFFQTVSKKIEHFGNTFKIDFDKEDSLKGPNFLHFDSRARIVLPAYYLLSLKKLKIIFKDCVFYPFSYLVVSGEGEFLFEKVTFNQHSGLSLFLERGVKLSVKDIVVENHGYDLQFIEQHDQVKPEEAIRGFTLKKKDWKTVTLTKPGEYLWDSSGLNNV